MIFKKSCFLETYDEQTANWKRCWWNHHKKWMILTLFESTRRKPLPPAASWHMKSNVTFHKKMVSRDVFWNPAWKVMLFFCDRVILVKIWADFFWGSIFTFLVCARDPVGRFQFSFVKDHSFMWWFWFWKRELLKICDEKFELASGWTHVVKILKFFTEKYRFCWKSVSSSTRLRKLLKSFWKLLKAHNLRLEAWW